MENKRGFVFVETIIVIVVAMVLLVTIYSSFSLIFKNIQRRSTYENINEIYKLHIIKNILTASPPDEYVLINPSSCTNYMNSDCTDVMNFLNIKEIFINRIPFKVVLHDENNSLPTALINYINTLDGNAKKIIVHSFKNDEDYYASINYGD